MSWMLPAAIAGGGFIQGAANYFSQKENLDWQKEAQKTTWAREDTAVQRRAADLEAAGLSKTLAAGGAAQSSGPISTTAPQFEGVTKAVENSVAALNLMRQKAEISKTYAEADAVKLQGQAALASAQRNFVETSQISQLTPIKVSEAIQQVKNLGLDQARKQIENQAAAVGLDHRMVDLVKARIETQVAGKTAMDKAELDLVSKRLAIEIDQTAREKAIYDLGLYKSIGYPTNTTLGVADKVGVLLGGALRDLRNKANQYLPEADRGQPDWAKDAIKGRSR